MRSYQEVHKKTATQRVEQIACWPYLTNRNLPTRSCKKHLSIKRFETNLSDNNEKKGLPIKHWKKAGRPDAQFVSRSLRLHKQLLQTCKKHTHRPGLQSADQLTENLDGKKKLHRPTPCSHIERLSKVHKSLPNRSCKNSFSVRQCKKHVAARSCKKQNEQKTLASQKVQKRPAGQEVQQKPARQKMQKSLPVKGWNNAS